MWRRGIRRALPRRDQWHHLQEYAIGEQSQEEFRVLRARDSAVGALVGKAAPQPIDWTSWEGRIQHKEVYQCLKDFHTQQMALLDAALAEDHTKTVKEQKEGWELYDDAVKSCKKSVEKSEDILKNGARALWISYHNPPISLVSQSEWLDSDQYWQAFVEKHQYYHNHICSVVEDPESKEYDQKQMADLKKRWETFDGKGTTRQNNKLLYQRPSYEYYDYLRGPLIEHMIFYLTKTGGDSRFFPQNMPTEWFAEIYDTRFKILSMLQRRKRKVHEETLKRDVDLDFHPHDLEHDGEAYYAKLIAKESAVTELTVARLMGNYIFFSDDYIPVQTGTAFYKALQADGGKGTFYSLGSDVNCLFYKPAEAMSTPDPVECFHSLADHAAMTGRRFSPGYATAFEAFCEILESRKDGLGGAWFTAPGESSSAAFMRRLKKADPAYELYQSYAEEHAAKWAEAKALSMDEALKELPEIERKYQLECTEYDNILYFLSDEFAAASKLEQEQISKLADVGKLQAELDSGALVAIGGGEKITAADSLLGAMEQFEAGRP